VEQPVPRRCPPPDHQALSIHYHGVAWSPWLTRTCNAPDVEPFGDCADWTHELHPLSVSALLLLLGVAAGVAARRLRPRPAER
jgi:hypothetical protein